MHYLAQGSSVDVLLTDVCTPGSMDGYELAKVVRDRYPHIAVLVTSGRSKPRSGEMPFGAWFIAKPLKLDALIEVIREALRVKARRVAGRSRILARGERVGRQPV